MAIAIKGVYFCVWVGGWLRVCGSLLPNQVLLSTILISPLKSPAVPAEQNPLAHTLCLIVMGLFGRHITQAVCSSITDEMKGEITCQRVKRSVPPEEMVSSLIINLQHVIFFNSKQGNDQITIFHQKWKTKSKKSFGYFLAESLCSCSIIKWTFVHTCQIFNKTPCS